MGEEPDAMVAALIEAGWSPEAAEVDAASGLPLADLLRRRANQARGAEWQLCRWPTWEGRSPWWTPAYAVSHILHAQFLPPDWRVMVGAHEGQSLHDAWLCAPAMVPMSASLWAQVMEGWYRARHELEAAFGAGAVRAVGVPPPDEIEVRGMTAAPRPRPTEEIPAMAWAAGRLDVARAEAETPGGQRWEAVRVSGEDCIRCWPLADAAPTVTTAAALTRATAHLKARMEAGPKPKAKSEILADVAREYGITERAARGAWDAAVEGTGDPHGWARPGAPKK